MKDFVLSVLKIHCIIYKKDFGYYSTLFINKENTKIDNFIFEFINIYKDYELYEDSFLMIKESSKDKFKNFKKRENFLLLIQEKLNLEFWLNFFSFSIINGIIKEMYYNSENKETGSVNIIELTSFICDDFLKIIDFLYVSDIIDVDSSNFSEESIKKFILRMLFNLKNNNIIDIKKKTIYNEEKNEIKYSNFITIDNFKKPKNLFIFLNISKEPSTIKRRKNLIMIGFYHYYTNTYLVSKKHFKSESIITEIFIQNMKNKANIKFYPDDYMLEVVKKRIDKIRNKNIEHDINIIRMNLFKKKILLDDILNKEDLKYEEIGIEIKKIRNKIAKLQKELSLNIDFWIFDNLYTFIKEFKEGLFFVPYCDFRGRSYTNSKISPQSNWIFRFLYNFGENKEFKFEDKNVLKIDEDLRNKIKKIGILKDFNCIAWVLISIGFQFKNNIRTDGIKPEEFIEEGIKNFNKFLENPEQIYNDIEISKSIECIYYFKIIEDHKIGKVVKRYLIKDTTASVYQHLGKILYFKNEEALNITNLGKEDLWRDTYKPLMNILENKIDPSVKIHFNRKNMKKLMFTTKYNIGSRKAFKNFKNEIQFIEDKETYSKIASSFQKIYLNLIKGYAENELLYENNLKDLNFKLIKEEYFQLDDIKINLTYHKSIKKEITIFDNKKRMTLANYSCSKEIDLEKTKIANVPNIVHGLDAIYARRICNWFYNLNKEIYANHDAFYVSYYDVEILIEAAQKCIKVEENFKFFKGSNKKLERTSIFILA